MNYNERLSGNEAIAFAMKQIDPDVMAAFPITPSTEIPQYFAQYVANGEVNTEFVPVESEHSSMSACIGAEAAGARAVTATSSAGLALMYEMMYVAASSRLPITLACVNRALTGPININNDHSDAMGARDAGWIQPLLPTERRSQACSGGMHQARGTPGAFVGTVAARSPFVIKAGSAAMEKGSGEYPASAQAYA